MEPAETFEILKAKYSSKPFRADPFYVLVHAMLSHMTTDTVSWPATERLCSLGGPQEIAESSIRKIEKTILPVNYYKTKARRIRNACRILLEEFSGKVPDDMEKLMSIPGIGKKSASIILSFGFGVPRIAVDTHVNRIAKRLGWVDKKSTPDKTQEALESMLPGKYHMAANSVLIAFGRDICKSARPECWRCPVYSVCKFEFKSKFRKKNS